MNWYFTVLKKYAQFSGRARRKEYWFFVLFNLIIFYALVILATLLGATAAAYIYYLAVAIPYIAVTVRRMHDVNKSGWYSLIPIYNLILTLSPGTVGDNEYGPDPKVEPIYEAQDYEKPYDINA
ncbi:DUF805 domain-containing protein [Mucilaginibacter agri]|uniref:DUF805 domain-containing protein n=1 Tax=Mucilaginibacter agri TaxID=2695265 RepID=A0A966DUZ4_9SPHI|nr:DUF805 domain-containing protein [Mucilaginibacter agri]NCD72310.1 DUF805 domain-containing protein [Mucilaginibacter agri]